MATTEKTRAGRAPKGILGELIAEQIGNGETDPNQITAEVLRLAPPEAVEDYLFGYVRAHVLSTLRRRTLAAESRVMPDKKTARKASVADMAELLDLTFPLPDGRRVTWADATVEDHRARAAMLNEHAERTLVNAARHERAIKILTDAGAERLAEVIDR